MYQNANMEPAAPSKVSSLVNTYINHRGTDITTFRRRSEIPYKRYDIYSNWFHNQVYEDFALVFMR